MELTRRNALAAGSGALAALCLTGAPAAASRFDEAVAAFTGGADPGEGLISLDLPDVVDDGNRVLVRFSAPGAEELTAFADDNPRPDLMSFKFGPLNSTRTIATRVRLARSQNVIVIGRMQDGSFQKASAYVHVVVGGCGGTPAEG